MVCRVQNSFSIILNNKWEIILSMDEKIRDKYQELAAEITRHNQLYYNQAEPEISDREYDELMSELQGLEKDYPELIHADSPTQQVGAAVAQDVQKLLVTHNPKMMSISNCYDDEGIQKFTRRCESLAAAELEYMTEMKIDGLAISLLYENGKLVRGATRGNGFVGEDVTAILKYVNLPKQLRISSADSAAGGLFAGMDADLTVPERLEVRGEVYMPRCAFEKIVSMQEERGDERIFANPRNAAAGALKTKILSSRELEKKSPAEQQRYKEKLEQIKISELSLWAYSVPAPEVLKAETQEEALSKLAELGLPVNPLRKICKSYAEISVRKEELDVIRHTLAYDTDGVVIKVNSIAMQQKLGEDAKSPNWAVAFKFEPDREETVVRDIRVQVGKFGTLTPVADLDPVFVSGSTVSHATLHNLDNIRQKDIRIGDRVLVEKAGEIIPQIVKSLHELRIGSEMEFIMPDNCPVCGSKVAQAEGKVAYYCENLSCPAQLRARLLHFVSREAMDIEGFGPAVIDALIERDKLHNVADLYHLSFDDLRELWEDTERKRLIESLVKKGGEYTPVELEQQELLTLREYWNRELLLAGRKEYVPPEYKNAENMLAALEESKGRGLEKLLAALAIEQLGATAARIIAGHFKTLDRLYFATVEEISSLSAGETFSYRTLGKKSAKLLYQILRTPAAAEKLLKSGQTLARKLENLGISGFGEKKREAVVEAFGNAPERLLAATEAEIAGVELGTSDVKRTLGDVVAKSLVGFLHNERNREILEQLRTYGVNTGSSTDSEKSVTGVAGKIFVLTGTLPNMGRSEAKALIESAGGRIGSAVSRGTDYLVAGEKAGSKLSKAESLDITIISEAELLELCKQNR